jgi:hypothetical protein
MAQHRNGGKPWTDAEEAELAGLLLAKTHPAVIAARLGRSVVSIGDKSRELRRRANASPLPTRFAATAR